MSRVILHIRFLWFVFRRLAVAWRALFPRLPSHADRVRAAGIVILLWLRKATKQNIPVPALRLLISGTQRNVRVREDGEFIAAFEVFATDDYAIVIHAPVRRILDLGGNVGFAALLFSERYPDAEIVSVEPAPDTFAVLHRNIDGLDRVRALNLAVGSDGPLYFDLSLPSVERQMTHHAGVEVAGVSLGRLLDDLGWDHVDLLKLDVEGAEFGILTDPALSRINAIVGEIHDALAPADYVSAAGLLPDYDVEAHPTASGATVFSAVIRG